MRDDTVTRFLFVVVLLLAATLVFAWLIGTAAGEQGAPNTIVVKVYDSRGELVETIVVPMGGDDEPGPPPDTGEKPPRKK